MGTERGMDRLIFFTDAVTAIAITLLILPLVDLVPKFAAGSAASGRGPGNLVEFLNENLTTQIFAFVLSFVVIARFWTSNHQILEHAERPTWGLIWLNIGWAFTIVVLPLPTEIIASFHTSPLSLGLYIGTMALSTVFLTGISWVIYKRPEVESSGDFGRLNRLWGSGVTAVIMIIALVLAVFVPHVTFWSLLLLFLTGPIDRIVKPRLRRWEAAKAAAIPAG